MPIVKDHRGRIATDPLKNFKFVARIHHQINGAPDFAELGFMSISGFNAATEVIPYREGGNNTSQRKLPGQSNYSDLTFVNGVLIRGHQIWYWFKQIFFVIQGRGGAAPGADFRARVSVHVIDHPVNDRRDQPTKLLWQVYNAWPTSISYSDLDAGGNAILVQQMVLAHEGWDMHWATQIGSQTVENRPFSG